MVEAQSWEAEQRFLPSPHFEVLEAGLSNLQSPSLSLILLPFTAVSQLTIVIILHRR